jgi:predicted aspartyl protease
MSLSFDPQANIILVPTTIAGPFGNTEARFALDTGATRSLVSWDVLVLLGYDLDASPSRVQITTASGVEFVPRINIERVEALEQERRGFPMLCHALPPSVTVDGLLGLDFLRGQRLVVDFRAGLIDLE